MKIDITGSSIELRKRRHLECSSECCMRWWKKVSKGRNFCVTHFDLPVWFLEENWVRWVTEMQFDLFVSDVLELLIVRMGCLALIVCFILLLILLHFLLLQPQFRNHRYNEQEAFNNRHIKCRASNRGRKDNLDVSGPEWVLNAAIRRVLPPTLTPAKFMLPLHSIDDSTWLIAGKKRNSVRREQILLNFALRWIFFIETERIREESELGQNGRKLVSFFHSRLSEPTCR